MHRIKSWWKRLRATAHRRAAERELNDELAFHLEMEVEKNVREGMSPEAARRAARLAFGGVERFKEEVRDARGIRWLEALAQDLRYAVRAFRRTPGFAVVAALVLALGVGANTAIFSAVNAVMLRPLPVAEPDRLVMIWEENAEKGWTRHRAAPANFFDWREQVEAFRDVAAYNGPGRATLTGDGLPEVVTRVAVTGNFFDVLGVRAARGRTFREEETWRDAARVAVLSDGFWARRYGRDPAIIGSIITVNELPLEVVGVLPPGAAFPERGTDLWTPHGWDRAERQEVQFRRIHWLRVIARLEDGASPEEAGAQLRVVAERLARRHPETNRDMGAGITPLHEFLVGEARTPLLILLGATALLLLLTCANVANLLLVRASRRAGEIAVRTALGAGPRRIARQMLTESLVLALAGGAIGTLAGVAGIRAVLALQPQDAWRLDRIPMDARVLLFGLGVTLASGILFGLAPALRGAAADVAGALREGAHTTAGRRSRRASRLLVIAEVALGLLLATGAGLLLRSFVMLRQVDPGFRIEDRVAATVALPYTDYHTGANIRGFVDAIVPRLERIPGVEAVTYTSTLPLAGTFWISDLAIEGRGAVDSGTGIGHRVIAPNYFQVMGVPLLRGRAFHDTDGTVGALVVILNQEAARRFFPNEDPIGRRITWDAVPDDESTWYRIVGVVGDERQHGVHLPPQIEAFVPFRQSASGVFNLVLHTRPDASTSVVADAVRAELAAIDPNLPLFGFRTLEEIYATSLGRDRFLLTLIGAFAALALLLAAVGVYGVTAEAARRRTREIGIRIAMGAGSGDVAFMILRHGLALAAAGILLGLAGAFAGARLLASVLYGIAPHDAITFIAVPAVLALAAAVASAIPAFRAARLDPVVALRHA